MKVDIDAPVPDETGIRALRRATIYDHILETDPRHRCQQHIKLGRAARYDYACLRNRDHNGRHDAFCQHTDGEAVRW